MNLIQLVSQDGLTSGKAAKPINKSNGSSVSVFCYISFPERSTVDFSSKESQFSGLSVSGSTFILIFLLYSHVRTL